MNDRTKKILATVGIIGVIIIGALLIYGILVSPARQPYRDAYDQYKSVGRANATLTAAGSALNAGTATDTQFADSIKTAQTALTSLKTENEALGKETVLKVGEGKILYNEFNMKLQAYMAYNENLLTSMLKVRPALYACNQKMANVSENQASIDAIKSCQAGLQQLTDIPNEDYSAVVAAFITDYGNLAAAIESMVALSDPRGANAAQYQVLTSQRDEATTALTTDSNTFSKNLQNHRASVLTTDVATKLAAYLNDKSRIF